ncbi:hypothetical protein ACFX4N_24365 [Priestia sp. YIM B13551]|uniref:hypothetical protein n=1 Tax=Priestia sp. YIM B13551 TaxID=3366306 RepID=UPI00366FDAE8
MSSNRNQLPNAMPVEFNEEGRTYLGTVEVTMDRMFIFGTKQHLHEMVSFYPGMGNGCYEVYGEIRYVPGHGYRMVKVEVELVTQEELKHLEKENSDHVLEVVF